MKKIIILISFKLLSNVSIAKTYTGKLRCWDNNNPQNIIPSYLGESLNSTHYVDENNRNSFIMDFSAPKLKQSFERRGFKLHYGWSISECEDYSKFVYRRIDFEKVLQGSLRTTNVKYFYYHPDGHTIFRVLKCENLNNNNDDSAAPRLFF